MIVEQLTDLIRGLSCSPDVTTSPVVTRVHRTSAALEGAMSDNRMMAGCEKMPRSAVGSSVSFDEGVDAAQAVLHCDIERILPNLRRFARSLTHDAVDPDDLVQECLARALGELRLWKVGTDLRAWIFRVFHNEYAVRSVALPDTAPPSIGGLETSWHYAAGPSSKTKNR